MAIKSLDILLLGPYHPTPEELSKMYEKGEPAIDEKLKKRIPLHYMEKLNHLKETLKADGHEAYFVTDKRTDIRNTWERTNNLINDSDLIIHLLSNTGGSMFEHGLITAFNLHYKTYTFISEDEFKHVSGLIKTGTRLQPEVNMYRYENDEELFDLVIRKLDSFQRADYIREIKKKLEVS